MHPHTFIYLYSFILINRRVHKTLHFALQISRRVYKRPHLTLQTRRRAYTRPHITLQIVPVLRANNAFLQTQGFELSVQVVKFQSRNGVL